MSRDSSSKSALAVYGLDENGPLNLVEVSRRQTMHRHVCSASLMVLIDGILKVTCMRLILAQKLLRP
jgi:hypothetical protein